ncbi:hypothetical protein M0804_009147 [Polistes exclamans]|nr:hypothetical protein M0804_009147 [Polistes exclamans]
MVLIVWSWNGCELDGIQNRDVTYLDRFNSSVGRYYQGKKEEINKENKREEEEEEEAEEEEEEEDGNKINK